ncbi:MAG: SdrD B-like domain-containing protein [Candidatus Methanosuratincola sp.]|jgi:hypothetical protein
MRKIIPALLIVTMLLAAYPVALISVRAGYGNGEGDATHYPLIAGQTICLGEVLVWHNDTHLSVKYVLFDNATAEGWLITGIHLHANTSLAGIPNSNGNPIPGQFMVKRTYDPGVNSTEAFAIDLAANGWLCGVNLFIAAHADVERLIGENCSTPAPEELPQSVTMSISWPVTGGSYYFPQVNVTDGGILAGKYGGWCADTDRNIEKYKNYTAQVFSSLGTLPDGLVEYPGNLSKINWILNQGFVGKSSQGGYGAFTYGDVQRAIWELIDDEQSNSSLNGWDINRVNEILTGANQNGGFVPGCGQVYAILLVPVDDSRICAQIVIIERELGCACAPVYQRETAWGGTEEFPGASWARYILYELTCGGGATPPDISVVKDAKTSYTRTWQWDIEKSVDPSEWHLFKGDSGTSTYTIQVTKTGYVDSGWSVSGSISITNNEDFAVNITSVTDVVSPDIAANVEFPVTFPYMLGAGETLEGNYTAALPDASSRTNTLTVTIEYSGQTFEYSATANVIFGDPTTVVNDEITVEDTDGTTWSFNTNGSAIYEKTFSEAGTYENTATIKETGQSDSATVVVRVYELQIEKTAETSFTRTYSWTIEKTGDLTSLTLPVGETSTANYQVDVDATFKDSDWAVSGEIKIVNPAPIAANITSVTDVVSPDIAANVEFPVTFPYMLGAGETLEGNYTAALPDASSRTNTLTVTLQNYDYSRGSPKLSGTTDFTVALNFSFVESEITEVDECITVTDDKYGDLGTVCYPDAPKTFIYSLDVGPYATPGTYYFDNTASFETNDQGINGSDSWSIEVTVQAPVRICGYKFYDLNANGEWDDGEPAVQGFRIQLSDASGSPLAIAHTDSEGWYCFEINDAGTYIVSEVMPCGWVNTTAASLTIEVLGTENGDIRVDFGNVCLEQGYGGKTIGFWSNKNGQALINSGDILALNGLNLYTPSGWTYPPFTDKTQIRTYLLSANARDMRWMLSAQLVGTMLNTRHGLDALTLVYVGPSAYVPTGFITIGEIMDSANDALTGNDRGAQGYWKGLLDDINNNRLYFVCEEPCDVVYP